MLEIVKGNEKDVYVYSILVAPSGVGQNEFKNIVVLTIEGHPVLCIPDELLMLTDWGCQLNTRLAVAA